MNYTEVLMYQSLACWNWCYFQAPFSWHSGYNKL